MMVIFFYFIFVLLYVQKNIIFNTEIKNMQITEKVYSIALINEFIHAALNFLTFNKTWH